VNKGLKYIVCRSRISPFQGWATSVEGMGSYEEIMSPVSLLLKLYPSIALASVDSRALRQIELDRQKSVDDCGGVVNSAK